MRRRNRSLTTIVLAAWLAVCLGCGGGSDEGEGKREPAEGGQTPAVGAQATGAQTPAKPAPPPKPTIADVHLDTNLAKTCLVKVGDALPAAELPDLAGKPRPIRELFGPRATVVVFWNKSGMQGLQELEDLGNDVIDKFAGKGVGVVTVNVGDATDQLLPLLESLSAKAPVLSDADGSYFATVATEHLPRTYVLDRSGKIRWFDTEYSESTRRNMTETIEAILLEEEGS